MTNKFPVFYDSFQVGIVSTPYQEEISFRYTERWLATKGNFPISLTMPLLDADFPEKVVLPWLTNLLPEESQLRQVAKVLRVSSRDVIGILEEIGGDTAGALSFGTPSKKHLRKYDTLESFYRTSDASSALEEHFRDIENRPFLAGQDEIRTSVAGGQKKTALAVVDSVGTPAYRLPNIGDSLAITKSGAPSTLIVKPDNPNLPGIVENEVWCLHLANAVGIDAADSKIIGEGSSKAIAILRFDRRYGNNNQIQRIHQEDFAQANSLYPFQKYEHVKPARQLFGLTSKELLATARHCRTDDSLALLDQFIFNVLVANSDAHAKNYSLIFSNSGTARLAPMYDILTVLNWKHITRIYAQKIAGRARNNNSIAGRHWKEFAKENGLRPTDVLGQVEEIADRILRISSQVSEEVVSMPGSLEANVFQTANVVEKNVRRMKGKLHL